MNRSRPPPGIALQARSIKPSDLPRRGMHQTTSTLEACSHERERRRLTMAVDVPLADEERRKVLGEPLPSPTDLMRCRVRLNRASPATSTRIGVPLDLV